jgi:hypothetical protein
LKSASGYDNRTTRLKQSQEIVLATTKERKQFFFEKKNQKTFTRFGKR